MGIRSKLMRALAVVDEGRLTQHELIEFTIYKNGTHHQPLSPRSPVLVRIVMEAFKDMCGFLVG
jgi:hypothetical protein